MEKLTALLVEAGALHAARLKRESVKRAKKKIAAAVYEYQADCDGEWGKIHFDFVSGTAEIVRLPKLAALYDCTVDELLREDEPGVRKE